MAERTALVLVFVAMVVLATTAYLVLASVNASANALVLAYVLILGGAADTSSRVVMHYGSKRRRR
jgi:hypothetical protein